MTRWLLPAVLALGCSATPIPPPVPGEPMGGTCESSYANLVKLGGCGANLDRWLKDCHDEQQAEATVGSGLPFDCLTAAKDCPTARACR